MCRKLPGFVCQESNDRIVSHTQLCYPRAAEENLSSAKVTKDALLSVVQEHHPAPAGSSSPPGRSLPLPAQPGSLGPTGVSPAGFPSAEARGRAQDQAPCANSPHQSSGCWERARRWRVDSPPLWRGGSGRPSRARAGCGNRRWSPGAATPEFGCG